MDYYDTLGVPKDADGVAIKKAYRRKAGKIAPRTSEECNDPSRSQALVALNKAYETLSDPRKREYYDLHGEEQKLTTLEQHALNTLAQMLMQISEQVGESYNFVALLRENCETNRHNVQQSERKLQALVKKTEKQLKCFRRKKDAKAPVDILTQTLESKVAALKGKIAEIPQAVAIADRCLEILKEYENLAVEQRADSVFGSGAIFSHFQNLGR